MKFSSFDLSNEMNMALKKIDFFEATPIQQSVIPRALKNKSVIGISSTGSGKTHSFLIPILEKIQVDDKRIQVVIISPTRELATQLFKVCHELIKHYNPLITVNKFIGGVQKSSNVHEKYNESHIVIGTPGRLNDLFLKENSLNISNAHTIVFDEADMSFEGDFLLTIDKIISKINTNPQYLVFSATISKQLSSFIKKYLKDLEIMDLTTNRGLTDNVLHTKCYCKIDRKDEMLLKLLKTINPYKMLIFASKKQTVDKIYHLMNQNQYKCVMLHANLDNRKRKRIVKEIYDDKYQYIIASDIAARGLDIEMVTHVIHYDLPSDINYYIHRSGRAGRFDKDGMSIILYDDTETKSLYRLDNLNIDIHEYSIRGGEYLERVRSKFRHQKNTKDEVIIRKKKNVTPNYKKKVRKFKRRSK